MRLHSPTPQKSSTIPGHMPTVIQVSELLRELNDARPQLAQRAHKLVQFRELSTPPADIVPLVQLESAWRRAGQFYEGARIELACALAAALEPRVREQRYFAASPGAPLILPPALAAVPLLRRQNSDSAFDRLCMLFVAAAAPLGEYLTGSSRFPERMAAALWLSAEDVRNSPPNPFCSAISEIGKSLTAYCQPLEMLEKRMVTPPFPGRPFQMRYRPTLAGLVAFHRHLSDAASQGGALDTIPVGEYTRLDAKSRELRAVYDQRRRAFVAENFRAGPPPCAIAQRDLARLDAAQGPQVEMVKALLRVGEEKFGDVPSEMELSAYLAACGVYVHNVQNPGRRRADCFGPEDEFMSSREVVCAAYPGRPFPHVYGRRVGRALLRWERSSLLEMRGISEYRPTLYGLALYKGALEVVAPGYFSCGA